MTPEQFAPKAPLEELLFASATVGIGAFRCRPDHPLFRDSGPCSTYCFVFPRTSVVIQHADERPFVADPRIVTYYNQGQLYSRRAVSPEGDHGEWFALDPGVAEEVVAAVVPRHVSPGSATVFSFTHGPSDPDTYLAQRSLCAGLRGPVPPDPLEVEETVLGLLAAVAPRAAEAALRPLVVSRRQRELVEDAKRVLAASPARRLYLADLAQALSSSVFHLCRVFKQVEGTTIHAYRLELRLRMALEPMTDRRADLTRIALDYGFSSHSHFTAAFRKYFGFPPSRALARLRAAALLPSGSGPARTSR
jgi:AraC family transcriptional regulator